MVCPFSNLSDEDLMIRYQRGDYKAFETIYTRHKEKIYSYLNRRITDKDIIDDLFQKILLKLHRSRRSYETKYPLMKWIYTICRSEMIDYFKKPRVQNVLLEDYHWITAEPDNNELIDIEKERALTDQEKNALGLRYYEDKDFKEISKLLETTETNVRKIISRGIKKLRLKYRREKS